MSPARASGFTLVELIVMISILGILAWIAYPRFETYYEIKLDAAARRVAADLRYAQSQAISRRLVHGVLFEPGAARYTLYAPTPATPLVDPADRARTLAVDFSSRTEYKGVTLASAAFGSGTAVTFDFFGVPRDSSGTELSTTGRVVLTHAGAADTVEVTPGTGKVVIR